MPVEKMRAIAPGRRDVYEAVKRAGADKAKAARIANAGGTKAGRQAMARKAAVVRKAARKR